MKNKPAQEARRRIAEDLQLLGSVVLTQRAAASERYRKLCNLSMTQLNKALAEQDSWMRTKLTRLNMLEVLLERRRLLGKLVWWAYDRLMKQMKKPLTMRPGPAPVPADPRDATKGVPDGATANAAPAVPQA
jgi:hypothetical protein